MAVDLLLNGIIDLLLDGEPDQIILFGIMHRNTKFSVEAFLN